MQVSSVSQQNFGLKLSPSMKSELCLLYKSLKKNTEGMQPEFLDKACERLISTKPEGTLDFIVYTHESLLGLKKEKQCWLELSNGNRFFIWKKIGGLFSKHKKHLSAEDVCEILFKLPEKTEKIKKINTQA